MQVGNSFKHRTLPAEHPPASLGEPSQPSTSHAIFPGRSSQGSAKGDHACFMNGTASQGQLSIGVWTGARAGGGPAQAAQAEAARPAEPAAWSAHQCRDHKGSRCIPHTASPAT